ncbi:MAG: hypothetical protein DRJ55_05925 [Thermoprotei archaeon]|nr:MAG: hypothetical protein DRJ55_05925 [Thermoprotei archaeon]
MKHRRTAIFLTIALIFFLVPLNAYIVNSSPDEFTLKCLKLNVQVTTICKADRYRVAILGLENGTILAVGKSFVKRLTIIRAKPIACDFAEEPGKLVVSASDGSLILVSLNSDLEVISTSLLRLLPVDETIKNVAVSQNARFAVLRVIYNYHEREAEKLVFVDLLRKLIVAVRDADSTPSLVRIFYFKRVGNVLLLQTLDTFCELCEYTDNLIEAYNLSSLKRLYWKKIGLSLEAVSEMGGELALFKLLPENGKYNVLILNYKSGKTLSKFKVDYEPQQILFFDQYLAFIKDTSMNIYDLKGAVKKTIKIPISSRACYNGGFLFVSSPASIRIYDKKISIRFEASIEYKPPPKPCYSCVAFPNMAIIVYHDKKTVYIISKLTQILFEALILDEEANPVQNAHIELFDEKGLLLYAGNSGSEGKIVAVIDLNRSLTELIKIKVYKEGFGNKTLRIKLENETLFLKIRIEKTKQVFQLMIKVLDEDKNPVKNAFVSIYTADQKYVDGGLSNQNGIVSFNLSEGKYRVKVAKQHFYEKEELVDISSSESPIEKVVILKKRKPLLTVTLPANGNITQLIISGPNFEQKIENITQNIYVLPLPDTGYYYIKAFTKCGSKNYEIYVEQNATINIEQIKCYSNTLSASLGERVGELLREIKGELSKHVIYLEEKEIPISGVLTSYDRTYVLNLNSKDKIIILELFYTKCWGCEKLIPLMNNLSKTYNTIIGGMVTIYQTDSDQDIEDYIKAHNVEVPVFRDTLSLKEKVGVSVVPAVIVIMDGKIRLVGVGAKINESSTFALPNLSELVDLNSLPRISFIVGMIFLIMLSVFGKVNQEHED